MKINRGISVKIAMLGLVMLGVAWSVGSAIAEEAPAGGKAEDILRKSFTFQKDLKSCSYVMKMNMKMTMQGTNVDNKMTTNVAMEKPNKYASSSTGEGMMAQASMQLVCDGTKLYMYNPAAKQYFEKDAPKDISELGGAMGGMVPGGMGELQLDQNVDEAMKTMKEIQYVGKEDLGGSPVHHIKYKQEMMGMLMGQDIWIADGAEPVMRKMVPDMSELMKAQGGGATPEMKMETVILMDDWKINQPIPAETFKFTPPEGATKVDDPSLAGGPGGGGGADPATKLVGKPAPAFKLSMLDGSTFDLAEHKDKHVIVLDFWATWCGPCRKAMPIVDKVANAFKDKGVMLVTVNLEEEPEQIKGFLEKQKLKVKVALDKDSTVAAQYEASGIPETVIIGKDGVVKNVHVGFTDNLEKELTDELNKATEKGEPAVKEPGKATEKTTEKAPAKKSGKASGKK